MKLFQECQKNFAILGINSNKQTGCNRNLTITYTVNVIGVISCGTFLFFKANTFEEYSNNAYLTTSATILIIIFTHLTFKRKALFNYISNLEEYYGEKYENPKTKARYEKRRQLVETCSEIGYFVIAKVTPVCWVYLKAIVCYFIYFTTDLGNDAFELPFFSWIPIDWNNPFGYLIAVICEYTFILYLFMLVGVLNTFGVGSFLFALEALDEIKDNLKKINDLEKYDQNSGDTLNRLGDCIQCHCRVKQFVHEFLEVFQLIFMLLTVFSAILMCGVLLFIQIELNNYNALILFVAMFYALYGFGIIFVICELGQRLTDAFERIADEIEKFEWYLFSRKIQRMLPIILLESQKPVELVCFGGVSGLRETFKRVVKSAFSYFLSIRKLL